MKSERFVEDFVAKFPKAWAKTSEELGHSGLIVSGEGAHLHDGQSCFDYYSTDYDPQERHYTMGVANQVMDWAANLNCHWECHDPGTYLLYED